MCQQYNPHGRGVGTQIKSWIEMQSLQVAAMFRHAGICEIFEILWTHGGWLFNDLFNELNIMHELPLLLKTQLQQFYSFGLFIFFCQNIEMWN